MRYIASVLLLCLAFWMNLAQALEFPLPARGNDVVGKLQVVKSEEDDTLVSIGQRHDIGAFEMWQANPDLGKDTLDTGTEVLIPSQFILPPIRRGIVVNLAELRLYYFPKGKNIVVTFPIGVGYQGWNTPRMTTRVTRKQADPEWRPTKAIRAEAEAAGDPWPSVVPPGPNNPLGAYALYLGVPQVLIHGTPRSDTVGRRSSHGCVRLFAQDIEYLFNNVPVGTPVQMIYLQDKIGWRNGELYLESEVPFPEFSDDSNLKSRISAAARGRTDSIKWGEVQDVSETRLGIPEVIN